MKRNKCSRNLTEILCVCKFSSAPVHNSVIKNSYVVFLVWLSLRYSHLPWNMKKVLRRYPFEILCGNWSLPYTGWEKPKKQIFPSAPAEISQFQNMASIKTNKIKKRTELLYFNFWKLTTLLFCPKWFIHSESPKNAICLWLSLR